MSFRRALPYLQSLHLKVSTTFINQTLLHKTGIDFYPAFFEVGTAGIYRQSLSCGANVRYYRICILYIQDMRHVYLVYDGII